MLGVIAEGGGDLTVVVESIVDAELEFVLLFVSIQLLFVLLSQPSANAIGTKTIKNNTDKRVLFMLLLTRKG